MSGFVMWLGVVALFGVGAWIWILRDNAKQDRSLIESYKLALNHHHIEIDRILLEADSLKRKLVHEEFISAATLKRNDALCEKLNALTGWHQPPVDGMPPAMPTPYGLLHFKMAGWRSA